MATKTKSTENRQEFNMEQVFALWKKKSKNTGTIYFTGTLVDGTWIKGFFNTKKKNPKEPDLRVYTQNDSGDLSEEPYISMWCNVSENTNNKYLIGKIGEQRIVAFIRKTDNEKAPYLTAYKSESKKAVKKSKNNTAEQMEVITTYDLPF